MSTPSGAMPVPGATWATFGHPSSEVRLEVIPRGRRWRLRRAIVPAMVALVLAGPAALLPPHTVWSIGLLVTGGIISRNRWREEYTIGTLEGACPRCGGALGVTAAARLKVPHPVECPDCRHAGQIVVRPEALPPPP